MKLSDILLLTLFFVMGAMIFGIKQMQAGLGEEDITIPVPAIKPQAPVLVDTSVPKLRLDMSTPETAGSYGRLSLDEFLAKGVPETLRRPRNRDLVARAQAIVEAGN